MKIGIISDTHDRMDAIKAFVEEFSKRGVEVVLHAGDIVAPFAAKPFSPFKFEAVFGNNCGEKLFLKKVITDFGGRIEPGPRKLEFDGRVFVLMHEPYEREAFVKSGLYHVVIYGHTHDFEMRKEGDVWVINPGEACGWLRGRCTAVVYDTSTHQAELIELKL